MIVPKSVRIDLNKPKKTVIHVTQDDNTREAIVLLYRDGTPYDVTVDVGSGTTVIMSVRFILPNGYSEDYTETELGEAAVVQDSTTRNKYTVRIDGVATLMVGFTDILVRFTTEAGQVLHSFPLTLDVLRSRGSDVDPDGTPASQSRYLRADLQVPATEEMTEPVGYNAETGQLVTTPGGGGGSSATGAVRYDTTQSLTSTQKSRARTNIGAGTGTYSKPTNGIPASDLAAAVQTSLGKADTAYQKPSGGITIYDLAQDVQQSISKADTAYQKPSGGIPASDMASAVQTALTAAGTAVQPSALNAYILRSAQGSKGVNDTQEVHVDPNGKLWTQPGGDGGGSTPTVIENTKLITMTYAAGDIYADMTAAQIYDELQTAPVNFVLIDRAGRQCALIAPPEESGGSYTAAKFFTLDDSGVELIVYSVSSTGTVSSTTIPIPEESGGGGAENAVLYVSQSLTTAQKTQARTNIGAGTYSKPSSGIPKTDLASAVQTSLGKADSAYQKPLTGISEADLAAESVVISPDTEHVGQYVSTKTYQQIAQASSDGFAIKPEFWPDNNTTIRGAVLDISSAAFVFAFLDTRAPTKIYVFTVNAQGVSANISTPLNADSLTAKTSAMTQPVGYRASDGTLWTAPGEGGGGSATIETVTMTMTAGQSSTVLSVNLGYDALQTKIAAGARLVSQMTVGQDTIGIEWEVTGGNATQQSIILRAVLEDANGQNLLSVYMLENQTGVMSGDVESQLIGNAKTPKRTTKSGAAPAAFALYDNEIYTCGTVTSLTITSALSGADSILIFTSGSTPTNLSLPSNLVFADGSPDVTNGVLIPSANYTYEINVSNRRALVSRWAVSS